MAWLFEKAKSFLGYGRTSDDGDGDGGGEGEAATLMPKKSRESPVDRVADRRSLTEEYMDYASSAGTFKLCFACIALYLCLAIVAFSLVFEHWTVIDSLYYSVVTFTTIGYGDLSPSTTWGKLFAMAYVIFGIAIVGVALGIVGEKVVETQEKALEKLKDGARKRILNMLRKKQEGKGDDAVADVEVAIEEGGKTFYSDMKDLLVADGPLLLVVILLAVGMGHFEGWPLIDSLYYCIITTTTVGYGDLTPHLEASRLFAVFFLPISVVLLAKILGGIAGAYMDRQSARAQKEFLRRELTFQDLEIMDVNKDGKVSMAEFMSFMLVAMQKVDKDSIDELKRLFNSLDADEGGTLDKEDLILLAQRKDG